jgi:hypothetical protein
MGLLFTCLFHKWSSQKISRPTKLIYTTEIVLGSANSEYDGQRRSARSFRAFEFYYNDVPSSLERGGANFQRAMASPNM